MRFAEAWDRFWFEPAPLARLAAFRALVMALVFCDLLAYGATALRNSALVDAGSAGLHWRPIYAFKLLGLQPIGVSAAQIVVAVGLVAAVMGAVGLFSNLSCLVAGLASIYCSGLVYSFEKVHHDKIALAFTLLALPFAPIGKRGSLDALIRRVFRALRDGRPGPEPTVCPFARFPLRVAQVTLAIGYAGAGISKLVICGLEWANGYTLMAIFAEFDTPWSTWLGGGVVRTSLFSAGALFVQCTFPVILLRPRWAWFYLPAAFSFHIANWLSMDTGPYMTAWFLLIAFVPLERVPSWVREQLRSRSPGRIALGILAPGIPAAVVAWIWFHYYLPLWAALIWIPILASVWLYLARSRPLVVCFSADCRPSRVAVAGLRALDWSGGIQLEPVESTERGLRSMSVQGAEAPLRGARAWLALARELPLTAPIARCLPAPSKVR